MSGNIHIVTPTPTWKYWITGWTEKSRQWLLVCSATILICIGVSGTTALASQVAIYSAHGTPAQQNALVAHQAPPPPLATGRCLSVSFGAYTDYTTGTQQDLSAVAVADFNNDGKLDFVLTDVGTSPGTGVTWLGNGDGTFYVPSGGAFFPGYALNAIVAGDFNGDGRQDVATANGSTSNVSILLGNGNGTFGAPTTFGVGLIPVSLAVGDFNGDGKLDLASANSADSSIESSVSILLGNGAGAFSGAGSFGVSTDPYSVAVGDFNGDGKLDLATANYDVNNVSILLGNGNGSFGAATNYGTGSNPTFVAVGDFNSDGKVDLAVADSNGFASILLGNGNGSFGVATNFPVHRVSRSLAVGDFNGDGKQDVATANLFDRDVSILLGNGDGSFGTAITLGGLRSFQHPKAIALGDFNGDGKQDIVTANHYDGHVTDARATVWINSTVCGCINASFSAATNFGAGVYPHSIASGDFNRDSKPDLAVANQNGNQVSVLLGNGSGSFGAAANFASGPAPYAVAVGDFNGDGKQDLAVATEAVNSISVLLGTGTGSFGAATNFPVGSTPTYLAVGDFNRDGKADLAVVNDTSNDISILLGAGNGFFGAATNFPVGINPWAVTVGDFNNDSKLDLASANGASNSVSILLGNGDGTFGAATNFGVGSAPTFVTAGDFNRDSKLDLASANYNSNSISILLGTGSGSFSAATNYNVGSNPYSVTVGDFNSDGKLDLAVPNSSSNNVSMLLGNGSGSFGAVTNYIMGANPYSVVAGDFNNDGRLDLASANNGSNNVSVLLSGCQPPDTLVGHVTWQGRPAQPSALQQLPVTLTLKVGITEVDYPSQTTSASGYFTVSVAGLASGTYSWRVKGPEYLANSGTSTLDGPQTSIDAGLLKVGDANDNNVINAQDFNILKTTFGRACGDPAYDDRGELNGDCVVNVVDFNLLKGNFGMGGAPPLGPQR